MSSVNTPSRTPQSPLHLRVFLASPGDVAEERTLALEVLAKLQYDPLLRGLITIETVAWDKPGAGTPMLVTMTPQEAIKRGLPTPAECDIVIVILWSRIGTPLPSNWKKPNGSPYQSGTEWEYCNALEAVEQHGKPKLLLYRRTEKLLLASDDPDFDEKSRQEQLVKDFFAALRNPDGSIRSGVNEYATPTQFKDDLTLHLRQLISVLLPKLRSDRVVSSYSDDPYYLHNRSAMLRNVRNFWIKGVLEQSLYAVTRLELGLTAQPDAVEDIWNVLVQRPDQIPQPLPPRTRISTTFDEFGQTLLILGARGTGKTTLLLELTKDLLARAEHDLSHSLPVVFNLSSWAVRQPPLATWLVDELWECYQVPRKHARTWIDRDLILPLLDGLDEVALACRSACVEAINAFHQEHGLVPMAVCSRQADYEALTVKLWLQGALVLQPLARQQIDHYLAQAGQPLAGVRAALQEDKTLWELLDTPLMLSIVVLAYRKRSAAEVQSTGTLEERRAQLLAAYTDAMFTRRGKTTSYSRQQTVLWLGWLAAVMARQNRSVFYLEWLQPTLLPGRIPQWIVFHGTALLSLLFYGLFVWLIYGLTYRTDVLLFVWHIGGLPILFFVMRAISWRIQPDERLTWQWSQFKKKLFFWQVVFLVVGLVAGLSIVLPARLDGELVYKLAFVLTSGLVVGLVGGLAGGLVGGMDVWLVTNEITTDSRPNEGIRRSWHNALLSGLVFGLAVGLVIGLVFGLLFGLTDGPVYGLVVGLVYGLVVGLVFGLAVGLQKGGYAYFQHLMLRFLLWRNNCAPWHYVRFLDYAAERVFLRKVGGGYVFIHRMLLEYFATLYPSNSEHKGTASEPPVYKPEP